MKYKALKNILLILLFCIGFTPAWSNDSLLTAKQISDDLILSDKTNKPKVALVLAGGGAKGLAHIGVLKVLEEAGLPIDIVVGNSMGSIVGGLYAVGYDAQQLDSITRTIDWFNLLLDAPDYGNKLLTSKKMNESYQLRVYLDPERKIRQGGLSGLIDGRNIKQLLNNLTEGTGTQIDFNDLPRPFACNATEVKTGSIYEFHNGDLTTAMRASMAIPGVFTPVNIDSLMLVDGFVTNNYPVDVARRMGADIIVGVDLVSKSNETEKYENFGDFLTHIIELNSTAQYKSNIKATNLYIDVDVTGFSATSFGQNDIETLKKRGETRAVELLPQIQFLRDSLLYIGHKRHEHLTYSAPSKSEIDKEERKAQNRMNLRTSSLSVGFRFDNDEYASIHANSKIMLPTKRKDMMAEVYARLGLRMKGELSIHRYLNDNSRLALSYLYEHGDQKYYYHGSRTAFITSNHQSTRFFLSQEWNKIQYTFGIKYDWHKYSDALVNYNIKNYTSTNDLERFFTYYAQAEYNSLNSNIFPESGSLFDLSLQLATNNLISYKKGSPLSVLQMQWQTIVPMFSSHFTFSPHVRGRALITNTNRRLAPLALHNMIGGLKSGMKMDQQIIVAGISNLEFISEQGLLFCGFDIQQRFWKNHFVKASVDGGSITKNVNGLFDNNNFTWGTQIGYSYNSGVGPLSITGYWSERTRKFGVMLNIGYYF